MGQRYFYFIKKKKKKKPGWIGDKNMKYIPMQIEIEKQKIIY